MQYRSKGISDVCGERPCGQHLWQVYNQQRAASGGKEKREEKGYKLEKDAKKPEVKKSGKTAYDDAIDEIDDLLEDQEQAEQYVQLNGQ